MAENKKSFILYLDQKGIFDKLSNEQAGILIKHIFAYCNDDNPTTDFLTEIAFESIKQSLKRDLVKYEIYKSKQKANGLKGGRPKTQKTQPLISKPKKADSVSVSVSDSDSVSDIPKKIVWNFRKALLSIGGNENLVSDWLKVRKTKKATNTLTAYRSFKKEVEKSELNINDVLEVCITNSWSGFKADWLNQKVKMISNPKKNASDNWRELIKKEI